MLVTNNRDMGFLPILAPLVGIATKVVGGIAAGSGIVNGVKSIFGGSKSSSSGGGGGSPMQLLQNTKNMAAQAAAAQAKGKGKGQSEKQTMREKMMMMRMQQQQSSGSGGGGGGFYPPVQQQPIIQAPTEAPPKQLTPTTPLLALGGLAALALIMAMKKK